MAKIIIKKKIGGASDLGNPFHKGRTNSNKGLFGKNSYNPNSKKKKIIKKKIKNPKKTKIILIMSPEHHNKDAKNYNR
jgi:hypothetical protein